MPPPPPERVATTVDKGHGRREKRTLRTTTLLTVHQQWPGRAQGFELVRERTEKGKTAVEVCYGITSLTPGEADAARLLGLVREHWRIENCLHYVRDVTLGEDACRVRKGSAPQVLAALRNAAIHLFGFSRTTSAFGPLPLDLAGFGAPGCSGRVSADATSFVVGTGGTANWSLAIPNAPSLLCAQFYTQALVLDTTLNALGAGVSDAWAGIVGN